MAPAQKLLRASCLLFAAAQAEVNDVEALVQTAVQSQSSTMLESQIATFKMMVEGLAGMSHPHKHHKGGDSEASKKHGLDAAASPPAGCSKKDFWAVQWHIKAMFDEYKPKFDAAQKEGDTETMSELVEDIIPVQCSIKTIVKGMSVNWPKLETCLTAFSNVTSSCVRCPLNFMQQVVGKSALESAFSCALKCAPLATASFKCGEATEGCEDDMLDKMAPCLGCINPKIVELSKCTGMPQAGELGGRLHKIKEAVDSGEDAVVDLVEAEAQNGREELQAVAKTGTNLQRVAGLMMSSMMD